MTNDEAIVAFERQLKSAAVVLDGGFGTRPGESDTLYRKRKEMAEIALAALRAEAQADAEANEPLTLEQLTSMRGEAVTVVRDGRNPETALVRVYPLAKSEVRLEFVAGGNWADTLIERGAKIFRYRPKKVSGQEGGR